MRPAYRYTLIVVALLVVGWLAAWSMWRPASDGPAPARTEGPRPRPVRAPPPGGEPRVPDVLDQLEQDEAEDLGKGKAAARRRQRELLIRERGGEAAP